MTVRVVSCFESDKELVSTIHKYEPQLKNTCSFSRDENSQDNTKNPPSRNNNNLFQFVKKTGTNLRARLVNTKEFALGPKFGKCLSSVPKFGKCLSSVPKFGKWIVLVYPSSGSG